ncbi:MAG TPA: glycosyltransferase [Thermoanaerobaculia bacterium]|nr:glycosyltransferase [Thermoanaerobaculia bacterium]
MSIAVLGPAPPDRGGIARETSRLVEELGRLEDVLWLTFSRRYPRRLDPRRFDRFEKDAEAPAIAVPILDWASPRSWRDAAARAASEARDGLLVPWWTAFWALPVRAVMRAVRRASPQTPRVLLCHNVEDHEGGAGRRLLARGALTAADAYVVHAEADRERLARIAPKQPVLLVPHPVEALPPRSREDARRRLGLEIGDAPLVLFLGLVRRYKGVDLLLDAAPAIVREAGARVAVVGEVFPDALDLSKRAAASPVKESLIWKDEYVGEEEMRDWMAACDAAVLPYRTVSGSGIAARAFAARRPAVAARAGGLPDVVVPGATGELFEPGDAAGLATAVRTALSRPAGFYEPGLAAAADRASWPRYAEAIRDFVRGVSRP